MLLGGSWAWLTVDTVNERAEHAHSELRHFTVLSIDAYESWRQEPGREELRQRDPAAYEVQLDQFLLRQSRFRDYQAWWLTTYRPDLSATSVAKLLTVDPQLAAPLRRPEYLHTYLDHLLPHHPSLRLPGMRPEAYHVAR
jgi:hypothetical protein